jgi:hypothetical protein
MWWGWRRKGAQKSCERIHDGEKTSLKAERKMVRCGGQGG